LSHPWPWRFLGGAGAIHSPSENCGARINRYEHRNLETKGIFNEKGVDCALNVKSSRYFLCECIFSLWALHSTLGEQC
jgi:hypothetical protein